MNKYIAKPWHFLFPIMFASIGFILNTFDNMTLSAISIPFFFSSVGSYVMILSNSVISDYTNYWDKVNAFAETMLKQRNPELWHALGFTAPPQPAIVRLVDDSEGQNFKQIEIARPPISKEVMTAIAIGVLNEGKTFSEGEWVVKSKVTSSPKYRKLQRYLEEGRYIKLNNISNPRMGYSFTKKGIHLLNEYVGNAATPLLN